MDPIRRGLLIGGGAFALSACASTPPPRPAVPKVTFTHRPKLTFDVVRVDVQQTFLATGQAPNVEHLVPITPSDVARQWAQDRLVSGGQGGLMTYNIVDASIAAVPLKTDKSISAALKTQVDTRYDGRIEVRLDLQNASGQGSATAVVSRSQTALENLSLNDRDELLVKFVEDMGRDLDQRLEAEINASLRRFLI